MPQGLNVKSYHNNYAKITNLNLIETFIHQYTKPKQLVLFLFYKTTPAPCWIQSAELNGSGSTLDLTKIINTRIQDIEKIDITGPGSNTLILNLSDVFDASTSTNILKVLGNDVDSANASWFAKTSGVETERSLT
jgi:hypothetical protein